MMDPSYGWEAAANAFIAARSPITGASTVRTWAHALPPGSSILDVGCGFGVPIAEALMRDGHVVFGVDASPTLVDAFRKRFPDATIVCESAQKSAFFNRTFDGVVA